MTAELIIISIYLTVAAITAILIFAGSQGGPHKPA